MLVGFFVYCQTQIEYEWIIERKKHIKQKQTIQVDRISMRRQRGRDIGPKISRTMLSKKKKC